VCKDGIIWLCVAMNQKHMLSKLQLHKLCSIIQLESWTTAYDRSTGGDDPGNMLVQFLYPGPMHHISATLISQQRMMNFRSRWTSARGADASHLGSLVSPVPFSLLICSHSRFQAFTNGATCLYCCPLCSFSRKSFLRFLQFTSLVHMASSCPLSLIPHVRLLRLSHKMSKLVWSFSLYPPLHHKPLVVA